MSSNTIYWSEYELNILNTLWETSHIADIIHHFINKARKQINDKAYHSGLRKKINYVVNKIIWEESHDNFIRDYYPKLKTLKETTLKFNNEFNLDRTSSSILKRANFLGVTSYKKSLEWSLQDIEKIKEVWPNTYGLDEEQVKQIENLFGRNIARIDAKAYELKLKKSHEVIEKQQKNNSDRLIYMNKNILGRDMNYSFAKEEIKKYKSKEELRKFDLSLYDFIHKNGHWDDLCSHMIIGDAFNYPQTFLYNCIKILHPNSTIKNNYRKAIYPKEIDVYVVEEKIGFEYDGFVYHSLDKDVNLDKIKDELCESNGIKLYRIAEVNKKAPESYIIHALKEFGYNVSELNVDELIKKTFALKYSDEMIINVVSKYKTLKDFRVNEPTMYSFITRKGMANKYLTSLETRTFGISEDDVIEKIKLSSSKFEFRENYIKYYTKMKKCKFHDAQSLYDKLYSPKK